MLHAGGEWEVGNEGWEIGGMGTGPIWPHLNPPELVTILLFGKWDFTDRMK